MVNCRSCGRIIASGTIRCSRCSTPYHLSCSHRYSISPEGIFDICCGPNSFIQNTGYQTRNARRNNKRRGSQNNQTNSAVGVQGEQQNKDNNMRFTKILKVEGMGVADQPLQDHCEIIQDKSVENNDIYQINDNEVEILDDSIEIEEIQSNPAPVIELENNTQNSQITLETVWKGISSLQNSITNISSSLETVSTQLNTFDPRINELESTLNVIKNKTSNFENVTKDVSGLRNDLEHITQELGNIKSKQSEVKMPDISEIFSEIKERDYKSRNIIIYNVPEDNLRISQDYSTLEDVNKFNALVAARDSSRAREILEDIPNMNLQNIFTRRIGRVNPNLCRPLRVTLANKEDVIHVMKNRGCVSQPYNVRTDLTKFQQNKIRQLKQQLEEINTDKNNPTMTIKFVNGEPKIVPIFKRE